MMKYTIATAAAVAALALAGCSQPLPVSAPIPQPTVTVTQEAEPAPVETQDDPVSDEDTGMALLDVAWGTMTKSEKSDVCYAYALYPGMAWKAFDKGSDYTFTRTQFNQFFDSHC